MELIGGVSKTKPELTVKNVTWEDIVKFGEKSTKELAESTSKILLDSEDLEAFRLFLLDFQKNKLLFKDGRGKLNCRAVKALFIPS